MKYFLHWEIKEYSEKKGRVFKDAEKAALIWKSVYRGIEEVLAELKNLEEEIKDIALKKQIACRIQYEEKKQELFKINQDGEYVYIVYDYCHMPRGIFKDYDLAWECLEKIDYKSCKGYDWYRERIIEKRCITGSNEKTLYLKYSYQDFPKLESFEMLDEAATTGECASGLVAIMEMCDEFYEEGYKKKLTRLASVEPLFQADYEEEFGSLTKEGRFENLSVYAYVPEWYVRNSVKNLVTGEYGFISKDCEYKEIYDLTNGQEIQAYFLEKDGFWREKSISPLLARRQNPDCDEGDSTEVIYAIDAYENWHYGLRKGWLLYACAGDKEFFEKAIEEQELINEENNAALLEWSQYYARHFGRLGRIYRETNPYDIIFYDEEDEFSTDEEDDDWEI